MALFKNTLKVFFTNTFNIYNCKNGVREMSRVKTRFTMPPFWQPKITRVPYPEYLTPNIESNLKDIVEDTYNSPLKVEIPKLGTWAPVSKRCGLVGRKIGSYNLWNKNGSKELVTLVHILDNSVIRYITPEELIEHDFRYSIKKPKNVYGALIVGSESGDPREFTKEYFNLFREAGVMPKRKLTKFYITPDAKLPPGTPLYATHYRPGDYVDVHGVTIDRGFQGVMVRWGFRGMGNARNNTKSHRRGGCIGGGGEKGRVWPGTKMPGHMGRQHRTLKGVKILRINTKHNVIYLKGATIPGEVGNHVILYDTNLHLKKRTEDNPPYFPTYFPEEDLDENLYDDEIHPFGSPPIVFQEDEKDKKK